MTSDVIHIGTRTGYRADFRSLASRQVHAARDKLGLNDDGFAAYLGAMLGWTVMPGTVARWEAGQGVPPGDVLLAAEAIAGDAPPVLAGLLDPVPHAFTAAALSGTWLTCYEFSDPPKFHADISTVTAVTERHVRAVNYPPAPRTQGHAVPYRNEIGGELAGRHLVGHWRNASDAAYFGAVHLAVLPGESVMTGWYTGLASDAAVSCGPWKWARLEPSSVEGADLASVVLRDPAELHALLAAHTQYDAPLALDDVREG